MNSGKRWEITMKMIRAVTAMIAVHISIRSSVRPAER